MMEAPSDYKAGYEKARLIDRETTDNYIAHTLIGDPVMAAVVEDLALLPQGVCEKHGSSWMKPFEHQVYHRNMYPCLPGFRQFFVVFPESPTPAQPGQGTLHHPSAGQHLKPVAVRIPAHHAQHPTTGGPSPRHQPPGVGAISPDDLEPGEPVQQLDQHQLGPIPVLDVGGMNSYGQEQPGGIHHNVALAPRYLLPRIVAPRPPFSVVFTDWLSMMAALGVASLPSLSQTWLRSASSTRSQVLSARHFRKYHHTAPHGDRS